MSGQITGLLIDRIVKKKLEKKKVLDVKDLDKELESLKNANSLLNDRLAALAMDYKYFINDSFTEKKIFDLRDNIQFRLYSTRFHVEVFLNHICYIENIIKRTSTSETHNPFPTAIISAQYRDQLVTLFDSIIYHMTSVFDYLATLTNYISDSRNEQTLMWGKLLRSVRGKNNSLSKTKFANTFDTVDRNFVSKLYDYRSELIHRKADFGNYRVVHNLGNSTVTATFFTGKNLAKNFKKIKELNKESDITIRYAAIWLLKESTEMITDLLFALKYDIESRSTGNEPYAYYLHPETGEKSPASVIFWHENLYNKERS